MRRFGVSTLCSNFKLLSLELLWGRLAHCLLHNASDEIPCKQPNYTGSSEPEQPRRRLNIPWYLQRARLSPRQGAAES